MPSLKQRSRQQVSYRTALSVPHNIWSYDLMALWCYINQFIIIIIIIIIILSLWVTEI